MQEFRLYHFNDGGHIYAAEEFDAPDDQEAICEATRRQRNQRWELWSGARKVAHSG